MMFAVVMMLVDDDDDKKDAMVMHRPSRSLFPVVYSGGAVV